MNSTASLPSTADLARRMRRSAAVGAGLAIAVAVMGFGFGAWLTGTPAEALPRLAGVHALALAAGLAVSIATLLLPLARHALAAMHSLERGQAQLIHSALHDHLTGLPNRRYIEEHIAFVLANARRNGQMTAVLHIDLDGFKAINDRHGHAAGDSALIRLSEIMQAASRRSDFLGRMGGDEFVVVVSDVRNPRGLETFAGRLVERIGEPIDIDGQLFEIGASIGIALSPPVAADGPALLAAADVALYEAKAEGRAGFRFHRDSRAYLDIRFPRPLLVIEAVAR